MSEWKGRHVSLVLFLGLALSFLMVALAKPLDYVQANTVTSIATAISLIVLARVIFKTRNTSPPVTWAFLVSLLFDFGTSLLGALARVYYYGTDQVPLYMLEIQPRLSMLRIITIVEFTILVLLISRRPSRGGIIRYLAIGMGVVVFLYATIRFILPHIV